MTETKKISKAKDLIAEAIQELKDISNPSNEIDSIIIDLEEIQLLRL